ncbi:hypothetical protein AAC387_Pa06g2011 [Persea americana]
MKAWKALRLLPSSSLLNPITQTTTTTTTQKSHLLPTLSLLHFFSAQPQPHQDNFSNSTSPNEEGEDSDPTSIFDSSHFVLPTTPDSGSNPRPEPTWNEAYRAKVDRTLFGVDPQKQQQQQQQQKEQKPKKKKKKEKFLQTLEEDDEDKVRAARLAKALLQAALEKPDDFEEGEDGTMFVKEEDQRSLSVGIVGAPNAGKSSLTNYMVGTKVAAVSRKTNTTLHEVLGVMTKGNTQICFFDTPGLSLKHRWFPSQDIKVRVESGWSSMDLYDALIVIFDVHRHLTVPDSRVIKLINHLGTHVNPKQKRVLCMNKVDLVKKKKALLKVAKEFGDLPAFERYFMISGLKGSGVKDLVQYLMEQAVKRPWDEDPTNLTEEIMKNVSIEVVREKMLDQIHQEIPYVIEHRLMDWKELRDGSLRVEQHFITQKESQRKILVGKRGSKIGRIGMEANEELRSIFKRDVHLILQVRLA